MRLTKIKLAGFKSFVDPTTFSIPSNLVGIVGPNGCGKSNIIDAVRWVMGEGSARSLRGESMADVIFNGSAARKPVGQAAIELVFDNSKNKLGGPWANYDEIAIKRLLSRDGESCYLLNGVRCRRRDITDIFLGTGLGPRSYAIIEQGMISRLIDAKPEELRVFLEEAAGVSKYKERRRETETRIRHTRENLQRLTDLREELIRQIQHLQRQARAAEQYQRYRAEENRLKAQLLASRWQSLDIDVSTREKVIHQQETALEARIAEQRKLEVRLETLREQQLALSALFNQAQEHYYAVGTEVTRLEQSLEYQRELNQHQREELQQSKQVLAQVLEQIRLDSEQLEALDKSLGEAETVLQRARTEETAVHEQLTEAEAALQDWQAAWEDFSRRASEPQRQVEVERTRIVHLERQLLHQQRRAERLRLEQESLVEHGLEEQLEQLRLAERAAEAALADLQGELTQRDTKLAELRDALKRLTAQLNATRESMQSGRGRLASLKTLQEASLARHESAVGDWLKTQGLHAAPRLAECLNVESGWEQAVETVLVSYLGAVCVEDLARPIAALEELHSGHLILYETTATDGEPTVEQTLASKIRAPWSLASLLAGVMIAADCDEMIARRGDLGAGESLITPEGIWVGRNWLRVAKGSDTRSGVLVREREIRALESALDHEGEILERLTETLENQQMEVHELERSRHDLQEMINQHYREQARLQSQSSVLTSRLQQVQARHAAIAEEWEELNQHLDRDQEELQAAKARLEEALRLTECLAGEQHGFTTRRENLLKRLNERRSLASVARQEVQQQALAVESLRVQRISAQQALERLELQREQLQARHQQLVTALATADETPTRERLQTLLVARTDAEQRLITARQASETQEAELRGLEQDYMACQRQLHTVRETLEAERLLWRESSVHRQTLSEQLQELGVDLASLLAGLPAVLDEARWQEDLEQLRQRIQRLGAVNLTAIEEFALLSERKRYLDAQNDDLVKALTTLENAIRKIDQETRSRFHQTLERVNQNLQTLFPRLFGGGQAYLELAGEDILEAGVTIMARPPGKRIGTIHLLSGGEKALTAVALIFAFFQLNPAPFCLLDEVDAPLDEANIGRFGELVREMSGHIQFIFVTHNKSTMAIAHHLSGVTMYEPGVSRVVAVDVDEAVRLAAVG